MNIRKLAIIALPDRVNDYVGLALKSGFMPVNSISGFILPQDIDQSDCVFYPSGWSTDSYLLQLVNRSIEQKIPPISVMQLGTNQKTIHLKNDMVHISYLTHCPNCLHDHVTEGTIKISDDLQEVTFYKFQCSKCHKHITPIHHIKHSIYAMDC